MEGNLVYMLGTKHGFAQSVDCPVQSVDPCFAIVGHPRDDPRLCNRARMMRGRGRCLPLCQRGSNVVLDFEAKDGTKSMNSKPTLLEDQRKEHEAIVMDEREAFYHATS